MVIDRIRLLIVSHRIESLPERKLFKGWNTFSEQSNQSSLTSN